MLPVDDEHHHKRDAQQRHQLGLQRPPPHASQRLCLGKNSYLGHVAPVSFGGFAVCLWLVKLRQKNHHRDTELCLKTRYQRGMRSVPPSGSGWVQSVAFENLANSHADHQPTRYRVVVLTSCHFNDRPLRQSRSRRSEYSSAGVGQLLQSSHRYLPLIPGFIPWGKFPSSRTTTPQELANSYRVCIATTADPRVHTLGLNLLTPSGIQRPTCGNFGVIQRRRPKIPAITTEQSRRRGSIVPHDYSERGHSPEAAQNLARHRRSRNPMVLSHRRESTRTRHQGFRVRSDGFTRAYGGADHLVGVLQSRATLGTLRLTGPDDRRASRDVAAEARLDVVRVAVSLRDSCTVARVRGLGRGHKPLAKPCATGDHGGDDSSRELRLVAGATERH